MSYNPRLQYSSSKKRPYYSRGSGGRLHIGECAVLLSGFFFRSLKEWPGKTNTLMTIAGPEESPHTCWLCGGQAYWTIRRAERQQGFSGLNVTVDGEIDHPTLNTTFIAETLQPWLDSLDASWAVKDVNRHIKYQAGILIRIISILYSIQNHVFLAAGADTWTFLCRFNVIFCRILGFCQ